MAENDQRGSHSVTSATRQRATVVIGDYELGPQIGKGSFATVYKATYRKTNSLVAIKSVVRSSLTRRLLENLETEINILRTVKHPSIVELIDCLKSRNHIHLVMEYCSLGDLASYMRKRKEYPALRNEYGGLKMDISKYFVSQLGEAMLFLRSRDIIHRDIKTQNLLLLPPINGDGEEYQLGESEAHGIFPLIKIADFGFARSLPSTTLAETLCGSPLYMAPEILHYKPYDAKADLWSIGAVIYEMIAGKPPFHASNHVELARVIERTNDNISFPDERQSSSSAARQFDEPLDGTLKDLVRKLLKMAPTSRMSFDDFFAHPALQLSAETNAKAIVSKSQQSPPTSQQQQQQQQKHGQDTTAAISSGSSPKEAVYQHHRIYTQPLSQAKEEKDGDTRTLTSAFGNVNIAVKEKTDKQPHISNNGTTPPNIITRYPRQQNYPPVARREVESPNINHSRRPSMTEKEQALAEREYVVVEKRAVEMNVLADELNSSPHTPANFYPPSSSTRHNNNKPLSSKQQQQQHSPSVVAKQMTALARAVQEAVSSQYNITAEAANGPLSSRVATANSERNANNGGIFNPLDKELAETFESRYSQGTSQENPTIRRMEGLAYKAFSMSFLADVKWRILPPSITRDKNKSKNKTTYIDPLADPDNGFLSPSEVSIEEAFVLYLRALSLLHRAMIEASQYWASIHGGAGDGQFDGSIATATSRSSSSGFTTTNPASSSSSVTVSVAFNNAVQWIRKRFNQCLDRADALKQMANGNELDGVRQISIVQVMYEQALALSKVAAMRELKWIDPLDCDRAYQLAIWMLSAILETASSANDSQQEMEEMDPEDRTIVEQFIASIVKRRETLQRRLMQQETM